MKSFIRPCTYLFTRTILFIFIYQQFQKRNQNEIKVDKNHVIRGKIFQAERLYVSL